MLLPTTRRHILAGTAGLAAALLPVAGGATMTARMMRNASGGRFFGAAARIDQIEADPRLRAALLRDCAWLTPEVHMKWDALEPSPDRFTFDAADGLVAFAQNHGLQVRGHTLLWDQSTPAWAKAELNQRRQWATVRRYFSTVLPRYRDRVSQWDVVNEPINPGARSDGLRRNTFLEALGPTYIEQALHEARALAPKANLAINDYGFDYDNPVEAQRREAFLAMLERLKTGGAPLDSVGIQAHLDLSKGPIKSTILRPFFQRIADLDLGIVITELDVKEQNLSRPLSQRDAAVADQVRAYLDIALDQPAVKGVITWGMSDRDSWLQTKGRPVNRGLPYDIELEPKPMFWAVQESLARATQQAAR